MADVFVSYSRQDSPFVTRLAAEIESSGKQVWIDTSGIEDTEVFPLVIRSAIEASDAFLFVISPASVASRFCEQEVDYARSLNKRLVPVLRTGVPDNQLPEAIRERSWIPFEHESEFDGSLIRLLSALDSDPESRRSHTRWLTKAIEWDHGNRDQSLLLRGAELRSGEAWLATTTTDSDPAPTTLQRDLLLASRQAAGRRSRTLVSASLGVTLIAVGLLVFALLSRGQAVQAQVASSAQALAVESQNDLSVDPEASVILALRAVEKKATGQTTFALREALDSSPARVSLSDVPTSSCNGPGPSVAFRPHSDEIAENACGDGIILADAKTGRVIRRIPSITDATALAFNPTGSVLAVDEYFGVTLLDPDTGEVRRVLISESSAENWVTFNQSGTMLASGGNAAGYETLFDYPSGDPIVLRDTSTSPPNNADTSLTSLTFTANGRFAIGATSVGVIRVFNTAGVRAGYTVPKLQRSVGTPSLIGLPSYVAADPVRPLLAVAVNTDSGNDRVEIWSTRTWTEKYVLTRVSNAELSGIAFSPDGTRLAVAEANGSAAVWSL